MSLFDAGDLTVCTICHGMGTVYDHTIDADRPCKCQTVEPTTGKYSGADPTGSEKESGDNIERERRGPIKKGGAEHTVLQVYADGRRRTSYDASFEAVGDFHSKRRESTRLLERGYLQKDGLLPNRAHAGRPRVDAYRITVTGFNALAS